MPVKAFLLPVVWHVSRSFSHRLLRHGNQGSWQLRRRLGQCGSSTCAFVTIVSDNSVQLHIFKLRISRFVYACITQQNKTFILPVCKSTIIKRLLSLFASFVFQRFLTSEILWAKIYYFRSYSPNVDGKHTNGQKATEIKNRIEFY